MMLTLVLGTTFSFSSCGSDDDEDDPKVENNSISGTTWKITSDDSGDFSSLQTMTFLADGNVTFSPEEEGWGYAKWEQKGSNLKIVLGSKRPDDYVEGTFTIKGKTATYVFHWADYDGEWAKDETHTMNLVKQ